MTDIERDSLEVDVLIVGGGPAGLATALHLANLVKAHNEAGEGETLEPSIAILEKGAEVGQIPLSGGVMNPIALKELIPDVSIDDLPYATEVTKDAAFFLTGKKAFKFPMTPPPLQNHGKWIVSLGQMCKWLGEKVAEAGVDIFPGFTGRELIVEEGRVTGVQSGDMGLDKDGNQKSTFMPGANVMAKVTVLCEGPRGSLSKVAIKEFGLDEGRNPQTYATGVKEIWRLPEGAPDRAGTVWHTMGWPLSSNEFGGGWVYFMKDNLVSIGQVTYLDYENPYIDPHRELQRLKDHPWVRGFLEGGECLDYGAKTIAGGGYWAVPKLYHDGLLLAGDSAGFTNTQSLKGIHYALKSGMLAAETLLEALKKGDSSVETLKEFEPKCRRSYIARDLWLSRNFHQSFHNGFYSGIIKTGIHQIFGGRGFKARLQAKPDSKNYHKVSNGGAKAYDDGLKFDNTYLFDKVTNIHTSQTEHEEDQPAHLLVADYDICSTKCVEEYGNPCQYFCPAEVYRMEEKEGKKHLVLSPSNCVHCKTCDIKDPYEIITWVPPEGGGGPGYRYC